MHNIDQMAILTLPPDRFKQKRSKLVEVYSRAYRGLEEYAYRRPSDIKGYLNWLYRTDPEGFLVAEEEGQVLGFVASCRNWWDRDLGPLGEIHELVVVPERQGEGIGSTLLEWALEFRGREHDVFGLWVGEGNERAKAFYMGHGFKPVGKMGKWIRMILKKGQGRS